MQVTGRQSIAGTPSAAGETTFVTHSPVTGEALAPAFHEATDGEVRTAVEAAADAAPVLRRLAPARRVVLLEALAQALDAASVPIVDRAEQETALGEPRLTGELARTTGQLRLFARVVADGHHLRATIDRAEATTTPPRPDLRRIDLPVGPVGVFGASNFPLAFGVAGGDTASALAAGCPVVAKAHPANAGTSELVGQVIAEVVRALDLPPGTFSVLQGAGTAVGRALVLAPQLRAVGFTGSLAGGRALFDLAASRPAPIPVHAEMGSTNPVWVTAGAIEARGAAIAEGLVGSFTLGSGQFCTKPGVVFVPEGDRGQRFVAELGALVEGSRVGPLLDARISEAFRDGRARIGEVPGVELVAEGAHAHGDGWHAVPALLRCGIDAWRSEDALRQECFGPALLVVTGAAAELRAAAAELDGHLTASIHATPDEAEEVGELTDLLTDRVGRIIHDGFPTGVTVGWAQHHGGPYPATTSARDTSVGAGAIERFLRPVAFQDVADGLLPEGLRDDNPWGLPRRIDGEPRPADRAAL